MCIFVKYTINMKVKVVEHKIVEKELDIEYPVYLYFQDEDCHDEYVKVCEDHCIRIKYDWFMISLTRESKFQLIEQYINNNLTSEEFFNDAMKECLEFIQK